MYGQDSKDLPGIRSPVHFAVIYFMSAPNRSCNMWIIPHLPLPPIRPGYLNAPQQYTTVKIIIKYTCSANNVLVPAGLCVRVWYSSAMLPSPEDYINVHWLFNLCRVRNDRYIYLQSLSLYQLLTMDSLIYNKYILILPLLTPDNFYVACYTIIKLTWLFN